MFVVFEGIDGSGKTTISNRVARKLAAEGISLKHLREGGNFASNVTEAIRNLGRDSRNLALVPEAEFLLYVARDVQMMHEVLAPALEKTELVIADRFLMTAYNLGYYGRHLSRDLVAPVLSSVSQGLTPDLVIIVDVEPSLARARRKAHKIESRELKEPSRKGLVGAGLQHRLRLGYLEMARQHPESWVVLDNEGELEEAVDKVVALLRTALSQGIPAAVKSFLHKQVTLPVEESHAERTSAAARFLAWVKQRAKREPAVAAWLLAGMWGAEVDPLREELSAQVPRVVLMGTTGLTDQVSFQLRERFLYQYPTEVLKSLRGNCLLYPITRHWIESLRELAVEECLLCLRGSDDTLAWDLRSQANAQFEPHVLASLAGLDTPAAWELRERWHSGGKDLASNAIPSWGAALMASITGMSGERPWALRAAAINAAPVAVLASLIGVNDVLSWKYRMQYLERATKVIMSTLRGLTEPRVWELRQRVARDCKEALEGFRESNAEEAWKLRELCLDVWPSTVVKSLGRLGKEQRGEALVQRQLERYPSNISLLKHAASIELGVVMPGNSADVAAE